MALGENASLFTIAQYGDYETFVKKFSAAEIAKKDSNGSGLLHCAISGENFDIALFLIQNGIDVNMINSAGQTALHLICENPNLEVANALLEKGGDLNIRDEYGNNPLWTAVFNCGQDYDLVELFMKCHPDVAAKNKAGRSPLDFAKQVENEKLVSILQTGLAEKKEDLRTGPAEIKEEHGPGRLSKMEYFAEAKFLWQNYVPKSGQAATVQGELIRAIERLRDEAQRNGNGNWDEGHGIFCQFILDTLCGAGVFDEMIQKEIRADIATLRNYETPYLEEDLYDRLTGHIVEWYQKNPSPIAKPHDPNLFR